ncbi:MAG: hypothetical protein IKC52_01650 [Clostridia bacterium]|nr:hypothetical protein [Clostridia bacterium]
MKKFRLITAVMLLVCVLALCACGGGNTRVKEKYQEAQACIVEAIGLEDASTMKIMSAEYVEITGDGLFDAINAEGCIFFKIRIAIPGDGREIYSYHYPYYDAKSNTVKYVATEEDFEYHAEFVKLGNLEGEIGKLK